MGKVAIEQGSAVTQTILGGLTIFSPISQIIFNKCINHFHRSWAFP